MMKQWTTLFVFLFLSLSLSAQQGYGRDIFVSSKGDSLPYRMIHPESVKPGEKYPLVLFLHCAAARYHKRVGDALVYQLLGNIIRNLHSHK